MTGLPFMLVKPWLAAMMRLGSDKIIGQDAIAISGRKPMQEPSFNHGRPLQNGKKAVRRNYRTASLR
jgi:hypothetical protein